MKNLFEALNGEISRNEELLKGYQTTQPGGFEAAGITLDLSRAKKTRANMDVVAMLQSCKTLKNNK